MIGPVRELNLLWSAEDHKNQQDITYFLTLMWRQTQSGQQFWNLKTPLKWSPQCKPDVSKVARALAETALVSSLKHGPQAGTKPVSLGEVEFTQWCTTSHWHSSAAPDGVATVVCGQTLGLPCFYWLPGAVGMASISTSPGRPEIWKAAYWSREPGIKILALIYFIMTWDNWTSVPQITH